MSSSFGYFNKIGYKGHLFPIVIGESGSRYTDVRCLCLLTCFILGSSGATPNLYTPCAVLSSPFGYAPKALSTIRHRILHSPAQRKSYCESAISHHQLAVLVLQRVRGPDGSLVCPAGERYQHVT